MRQRIFLHSTENIGHIISMWKIGPKLLARPIIEDKFSEFKILNSDNKQVSRFFRGECELLKFEKEVKFEPYIESEAPPIIESLDKNLRISKEIFLDFKLLVEEDALQELRKISKESESGKGID
jgi:hypothetical protein